jgi:hypothetical protein
MEFIVVYKYKYRNLFSYPKYRTGVIIMKKIIILSMLIFSFFTMAQELNTDGKDYSKELIGKWGVQDDVDDDTSIKIFMEKNKMFLQEGSEKPSELKKLNNYTFYTEEHITGIGAVKTCFSYDIKLKKLVHLPVCGIDEWDDSYSKMPN